MLYKVMQKNLFHEIIKILFPNKKISAKNYLFFASGRLSFHCWIDFSLAPFIISCPKFLFRKNSCHEVADHGLRTSSLLRRTKCDKIKISKMIFISAATYNKFPNLNNFGVIVNRILLRWRNKGN